MKNLKDPIGNRTRNLPAGNLIERKVVYCEEGIEFLSRLQRKLILQRILCKVVIHNFQ